MFRIDQKGLLRHIRDQLQIDWYGLHGVKHWARVLRNGLLIAAAEGAREDVVLLFSLLHDHRRINEDTDPDHGQRASAAAMALRDKFFTIDDAGFKLLTIAMTLHSDGKTTQDPTLGACWDADRLDLGRVGIYPDPHCLCTDTAADPVFLEDAFARSTRKTVFAPIAQW